MSNPQQQPQPPRRARPAHVSSSVSETSLPDLDLTITVRNQTATETGIVATGTEVAARQISVATLAPPPAIPQIVIEDSDTEVDEDSDTEADARPLLTLPTRPHIVEATEEEEEDDDIDMYEAVDSSVLPDNEQNTFREIEKKAAKYYCGICFNLCKNPVTLPCRHVYCAEHLPSLAQTSRKCPSCRHSIAAWLQFARKNPNEIRIPSLNESLKVLKQKRCLYVKRIKLFKELKANSEALKKFF